MLKDLSLSLLSTEQQIEVCDRIVRATTGSSLEVKLARRIARTLAASSQLTIAYNKNRKSAYTSLLNQADEKRDNGYRAFKFIILSATYRYPESIKNAAILLNGVLKRHNTTMYALSHVAQSAEMKSLVTEMDGMYPAMDAAQVTDVYEEMKTFMQDFDGLYQQKLESESGKETPNITTGKKSVNAELILLLRQVDIMLADEEPGVTDLVNKYNDIIGDIMTSARARQTRRQNEAAKSDSGQGDSRDEAR